MSLCPDIARCDSSLFAGEALQATGYQPLQAEVARRGRFMAGFRRDVLSPACANPDGPFQGVSIDLNGVGTRFANAGTTARTSSKCVFECKNACFWP